MVMCDVDVERGINIEKSRWPVTHSDTPGGATGRSFEAEALKAVVRRDTEQVHGQGDFDLFDELFAEDFVDHTRPSQAPRLTKTEFAFSATGCAKHFLTSGPKFMADNRRRRCHHLQDLPRHHRGDFTRSPSPPARQSTVKPSTPCESATENYPPLGGRESVFGAATTRTATAHMTERNQDTPRRRQLLELL